MRKHNPNQSLSDILTNIEAAHQYIGSLSHEEFSANAEKLDAVQLRLQHASEAMRRLRKDRPDIMMDIQKRHPHVPWEELRGFSSVSRHDYDLVESIRIWEELQPNGSFTRAADAIRSELPLSQIEPTIP
jgi:uncharacterized protein with HEPN domain